MMQEVRGVKVCGIVQQPVLLLPVVQQCLAAGLSEHTFKSSQNSSQMRRCLHLLFRWFMHYMLWWVHGAPSSWNDKKEFERAGLIREGQRSGYQFLQVDSDYDLKMRNFLRELNPDLIVLLGDLPLKDLAALPLLIRVSQREGTTKEKNVQLAIEYLESGSDQSCPITSFKLPMQAYDTPIGVALKMDLIADDLLVQIVANLTCRSAAETSREVNAWMQRMLSPYMEQLEHAPSIQQQPTTPRRHRSVWKLCLETIFLCSPWFAGRNFYRRLRGRYPVLVLAHHLISDRPHYMGVSTENFWHEVCFLRRHYQIVALSTAAELLRSGRVKVPTLAITFDDGYGENFVNLRAVAEEFGIPITLFVSTEPVEEHREFEHDLRRGTKGAFPLTWDQIGYWDRMGVEIGSHTRTHFDCGSDRTRLEPEIVGSKNELEAHLGKQIRFFAFPFGKQRNISSDALQLAADTYICFASAFGGENFPKKGMDHSHFFRKNFYPHPWELELELQSVFHLVDRIKVWFSPPLQESAYSSEVSTISPFTTQADTRHLVPTNETN